MVVLIGLLLLNACTEERDYRPESHLTVPQQEEMMEKVIRYMAKPPDGIQPEERFLETYNDHYQDQRRQHRLDAYYLDGSTAYFLVSRPAPSLTEKRVAIGGAMQEDEKGLTGYVEVFRTWKMQPDTLAKRSMFLFDLMVEGESLESFYSSKTGNTDYIEFPDDRTYFDSITRMWKAKPR